MSDTFTLSNMAGSGCVHDGIRYIETGAALLKLKAITVFPGVGNSQREREILLKVRVRNCLKVEVNGLGGGFEVSRVPTSSLCKSTSTWSEGRLREKGLIEGG